MPFLLVIVARVVLVVLGWRLLVIFDSIEVRGEGLARIHGFVTGEAGDR